MNELKQIHNISNLWDTAKAVHRGKFTAVNPYIKKERFQINHLAFHIKTLEKEEQSKTKRSRRKEIIQIRVEIRE